MQQSLFLHFPCHTKLVMHDGFRLSGYRSEVVLAYALHPEMATDLSRWNRAPKVEHSPVPSRNRSRSLIHRADPYMRPSLPSGMLEVALAASCLSQGVQQ